MSSSDVPNFITRRIARNITGDAERGFYDQVIGTAAASGKGIVDSALGLGRAQDAVGQVLAAVDRGVLARQLLLPQVAGGEEGRVVDLD